MTRDVDCDSTIWKGLFGRNKRGRILFLEDLGPLHVKVNKKK